MFEVGKRYMVTMLALDDEGGLYQQDPSPFLVAEMSGTLIPFRLGKPPKQCQDHFSESF